MALASQPWSCLPRPLQPLQRVLALCDAGDAPSGLAPSGLVGLVEEQHPGTASASAMEETDLDAEGSAWLKRAQETMQLENLFQALLDSLIHKHSKNVTKRCLLGRPIYLSLFCCQRCDQVQTANYLFGYGYDFLIYSC